MTFVFQGITTQISENHPDIKACKKWEDLKKLNLLTGGTDDDYKDLWAQLHPAADKAEK